MLTEKRPSTKKYAVLLLSFIALLTLTLISSVYALQGINYVVDVTPEPVADSFEKAVVDYEVSESEGGVYTITNTGNVPIYIRVAVKSVWANENDLIHYTTPEMKVVVGSDAWYYTSIGFYYNKVPVQVGESATITVTHDDVQDPPPPSYALRLNLVIEAIQGDDGVAFEQAWGNVDTVPNAGAANDDTNWSKEY